MLIQCSKLSSRLSLHHPMIHIITSLIQLRSSILNILLKVRSSIKKLNYQRKFPKLSRILELHVFIWAGCVCLVFHLQQWEVRSQFTACTLYAFFFIKELISIKNDYFSAICNLVKTASSKTNGIQEYDKNGMQWIYVTSSNK